MLTVKTRPDRAHIERTLAYCTGVHDYREGRMIRHNPYAKEHYVLYMAWREGYLTEMRRLNRDKEAGALYIDCIKKRGMM